MVLAYAPLHCESIGDGEPVVLVHGSFAVAAQVFSAQRELADAYRVIVVERRGFGASPPVQRVDWETDAADLAALLDEPAHLVGHSYGGLGCLLAAARRPEAVRSLTVIEPPAFALARGERAVDELVGRLERVFAGAEEADPLDVLGAVAQAFGHRTPRPETQPQVLAAIRASATERPPWEAEIPTAELAAGLFPKLVVSGGWQSLPRAAREAGGHAFNRVCDLLAERIGAQRLVFENAGHAPQLLGAAFNERLRALFASAR